MIPGVCVDLTKKYFKTINCCQFINETYEIKLCIRKILSQLKTKNYFFLITLIDVFLYIKISFQNKAMAMKDFIYVHY